MGAAGAAADVWEAWTDPDRLLRWLGAVDGALVGSGTVVHIAMTATELPEDPATAENAATFTVLEASPPIEDNDGRLAFTFDDPADPGGVVTVTMAAEGADRCRLVLRHALAGAPDALDQCAGFDRQHVRVNRGHRHRPPRPHDRRPARAGLGAADQASRGRLLAGSGR